jgi:hypothetical protein
MNTRINEENLRELAYRIWEAEGCPPGQAERHWQMALEQAQIEQESYTTGESFLGDTASAQSLIPEEPHYQLQNAFEDEVTQTAMEASAFNTPQQPLKGKQRKSAKSKNMEALEKENITQNSKAGSRGKSGKRKSSDDILV